MTLLPSLRRIALGAALLTPMTLPAASLHAQEGVPTRVVVRAVSNGAKIIGSGVGGARITIRDVTTGKVLAEGVQEGSTGSTDAIMGPREPGAPVFDTEGAADFEAELHLTEPTRVEVSAEGPLGTPHAVQRASKTLLLVPGEHLTGDGVVLVLNGFTVEILEVHPPEKVGGDMILRVRITMLCGCPTEPGGMWDSGGWHITARLIRNGNPVSVSGLGYTGTTSEYGGRIPVPGPGAYELRVVAVDPEHANAGMATREIMVEG